MEKIKNFVLPENTNRLYKEEAISSIALTREVAIKINELVAAYNELSEQDLQWKQTQEGIIRKGVLYMKDNLVNSLQELLDIISVENVVERRLANKIDKDSNGVITLAMLSQAVKEAMTGGSVAVVDTNAVDNDNIVNRAVSEGKLRMSLIPVKMFATDNSAFNRPIVNISVVNGSFVYELSEGFTSQINLITPSTIYTMKPGEVALIDNGVQSATPHLFYDPTEKVLHIAKPNDRNFDNMLYLGGAYENDNYASCVIPYEYKGVLHTPSGIKGGSADYSIKTVSFLGDSVTTYTGYVPEGNAVHYNGQRSGVSSVDQCWWKRVLDKTGYTLNTNQSFSGSRVVTGRDDGADGVTRSASLDNGTNPDIIIVFMGFNDAAGNVGLGTYNGKGAVPADTAHFREGYANMLVNILRKYKTSKVYVMTLTAFQSTTDDIESPESNSRGIYISEYNNAIRELAKSFNVEVIDTECCGITNFNGDLYMGDFDPVDGSFLHPNAEGHRLIAECVLKTLK